MPPARPGLPSTTGVGFSSLPVSGGTGNHHQAGGGVRLGHAAFLVKLNEINIRHPVARKIDGILPVTAGKAAGCGLALGLLGAFQQGAVGGADVKPGGKSLQTVDQMPLSGARIFGHHAQGAHVAGFVLRSAHDNQAAPRSLAHGVQAGFLHHAVHHLHGGLKALPPAPSS